jgi:hypothetical protein
VAYRPAVKRRLCKQRLLLGNAHNERRTVFSVARAAAVSGKQVSEHVPVATDTNATIQERCLLCGPSRHVISRGQKRVSQSREGSAWEDVKKGTERVKLENLHC